MSVEAMFPFTAVVGQHDTKLALTLAAVEPSIGGVLLRGQKGTAKTTLARGLAALLPGGAPFVELPLGATEDRVVGSIDLAAALTGNEVRFSPGVLAAADGGVLYVDEVNLLADHLVDVLLDVAVSGVNRVEREGISHSHAARFVLVGSMNPEEGELRPQLLDRFGLCVDVSAAADVSERAEAVRRRLAFDSDPATFSFEWSAAEADLVRQIRSAAPARLPAELLQAISALCAGVGAESLRADLVVSRAACALAALEARWEATIEDVRRVAPLALAHRRRRGPFDDPGISQEDIDDALRATAGEAPPAPAHDREDRVVPTGAPAAVPLAKSVGRAGSPPPGRRSTVQEPGGRGRLVSDRAPAGPIASVAVAGTVRAAAARSAAEAGRLDAPAPQPLTVAPADLREAVRERKAGNLVVLAVDASGSMGASQRMEAAKGAVAGFLVDAYQRRDQVALVSFRGESADVALRPTGSVEVARARLAELPTGGRTPLAEGVQAALDVALAAGSAGGSSGRRPVIVVVSDGRANAGPPGANPLEAAWEAGAAIRARGIAAVVVDAETGRARLGLASKLAGAMGADLVHLDDLSAGSLAGALRDAIRR